jgi:hypothetical protein
MSQPRLANEQQKQQQVECSCVVLVCPHLLQREPLSECSQAQRGAKLAKAQPAHAWQGGSKTSSKIGVPAVQLAALKGESTANTGKSQ